MWNTDGEMLKHYRHSSSARTRGDPVLSGLPPGSGVRPLWENESTMWSGQNGPKKRNPAAGRGGVSEAFAVSSCKVDGSGRDSAECKRNLHQNTDIPQG